MRLRRLLPVAAVVASVTLIAGCGSSGNSAADSVTIDGLKQPGTDQNISVDLSKAPTFLQKCLQPGTVSQRDYSANCVIPYINGMWTSSAGLFRAHDDLAQAADDWLVEKPASGGWPVYYPAGNKAARADINRILQNSPSSDVSVKELPNPLPIPGTPAGAIYQNAGLLYLPNSYVVPGGIFNEMYGWDSYFIIKGLLASAEYTLANPNGRYWDPGAQDWVQLNEQSAREYAAKLFNIAKGMADNHAFEINFYGGMVNNANRIYYLTRSQPPLFAHEVRAIYDFAKQHADLVPYQETLAPYLGITAPTSYDEWLAKEILPAARTYFDYYTDPNHLIFNEKKNPRVVNVNGHNVSLYVTDGVGPAPEITKSKVEGNKGYYDQVAQYFEAYPEANPNNRFYNPNAKGDATKQLTQLYYRSDRTTRASGYDLSGRFGMVGEWDAMYAPVDLQALVYQFALDLNALITTAQTGDQRVTVKPVPNRQLESMRTAMRELFWRDSAGPAGGHWADLFVGPGPTQPSPYLYATTLVPLWADGMVNTDQIGTVVQTVKQSLPVGQQQIFYAKDAQGKERAYKLTSTDGKILGCESGKAGCVPQPTETVGPIPLLGDQNYGIPTSQQMTGNQWDYPNSWAPLQYFASDGLRAHKFEAEADSIDRSWINAVDVSFSNTAEIIEKYVTTNPSAAPPVTAGYSADQAGFGWTNAMYLEAWLRQNA